MDDDIIRKAVTAALNVLDDEFSHKPEYKQSKGLFGDKFAHEMHKLIENTYEQGVK